MPPHNLSAITTRSFNTKTTTGMAFHVVFLIVIGIVLIVAILLMPKGFFLNLASKLGFSSNKDRNKARPGFGRKSETVAPSATEKPKPTFVQRRLEMLRAWQKQIPPPQRSLHCRFT